MTDLTEQWKKGELPEGHYYIKTRSETNIDEYIQWYKDHGIPSEKSFAYFNVQQVLAPVPSYDEYMTMKDCVRKEFEAVEKYAKLKELLKECRPYIGFDTYEFDEKVSKLLTKIDEVLK